MPRFLITAGATSVAIDSARKITNLAKGKTGQSIGVEAAMRGHQVCLLTSNPHLAITQKNIETILFDSFDDLLSLLEKETCKNIYDAIIMTAAVSDYSCHGIFHTPDFNTPVATSGNEKLSGGHRELWLRLKPLPKLIDQFRTMWNFKGTLVKFKLESNIDEQKLLHLAELSRQHSNADLMVANRVEDAAIKAWIGPINSSYQCVTRDNLPVILIDAIEKIWEAKQWQKSF